MNGYGVYKYTSGAIYSGEWIAILIEMVQNLKVYKN